MPINRRNKSPNTEKYIEQEFDFSEEEQLNPEYMKNFARALNRSGGNPEMFSALWNSDSNGVFMYSRKEIKAMMQNPDANKQALRNFSNYLFKYISQYKTLVKYLSEMLMFNYLIEPTNADEEDKTSTAFKKSWKKTNEWLDNFDLKQQAPDIVYGMILEDAKFYYLRESQTSVMLQEMPSSYCRISGKNDLGFQYEFNMRYFFLPGTSFDHFHSDFRKIYNQIIGTEDFKNNSEKFISSGGALWVPLNPERAWVFKFDMTTKDISPPLMGMFLDAMEILPYKELLKTKTSLDVWKIILNKIPMHKDGTGKGGNKKDAFAIDSTTAAEATAMMQGKVNEGVKVITTPFETEVIEFTQKDAKNSLDGLGVSQFFGGSGFSGDIFGGSGLASTAMNSSIKVNEMFVIGIYRQFKKFIDYNLRQQSKRYRFKIHLSGTYFNQEAEIEKAIKAGGVGAPAILLAQAMGYTPQQWSNLLWLDDFLGLKDKMIPLQTSYTIPGGEEEGGRPEQSVVGDEGDKSRDQGANIE